jgi:hypothetical protein
MITLSGPEEEDKKVKAAASIRAVVGGRGRERILSASSALGLAGKD